jgi:heavy-metal-associated domain-containing protein
VGAGLPCQRHCRNPGLDVLSRAARAARPRLRRRVDRQPDETRTVSGVRNTDVILQKREVVVTYDDAKTNVPALAEATKNAGYQSTPVKDATR